MKVEVSFSMKEIVRFSVTEALIAKKMVTRQAAMALG